MPRDSAGCYNIRPTLKLRFLTQKKLDALSLSLYRERLVYFFRFISPEILIISRTGSSPPGGILPRQLGVCQVVFFLKWTSTIRVFDSSNVLLKENRGLGLEVLGT